MPYKKVIIVHPFQGFVNFIRKNLYFVATNVDYPIKQVDVDIRRMLDKYQRSQLGIIVSSSENGIIDVSRLASNVNLSERDVLIPDFVPHYANRRPDWARVFSCSEERLNLNKNIPIVVGGFALHDCVSDFAQEGVRKGYSVFIDEWMTELFKP